MGSRRSAISARPEGARCHTGNNLVGSAGTLLIDLSAEDGGPRASKQYSMWTSVWTWPTDAPARML